MNAYYQSLLQEIEKQIDEKRYVEAYELIRQELSMPYVPQEAMDQLQKCELECKPFLQTKQSGLNFEKLQEYIHGNTDQKLYAIEMLKNMNLRMFHNEIQTLLDSDLSDEYKGELIEALMEQKIDDPFEMVKSGLNITFIPSAILPMALDTTITQASSLFETWFLNENPTMVSFCMTLLVQLVLYERPFDQQDKDAYSLAKAISRLVYMSVYKSDEWPDFVRKNGLEKVEDIELSIEKRGENDD